jgi:hypothetical protein
MCLVFLDTLPTVTKRFNTQRVPTAEFVARNLTLPASHFKHCEVASQIPAESGCVCVCVCARARAMQRKSALVVCMCVCVFAMCVCVFAMCVCVCVRVSCVRAWVGERAA